MIANWTFFELGTPLMTLIEIGSWTALAGWLCVMLDRSRSWPGEMRLPVAPAGERVKGTGSLAVVVPARNEADLLPQTLVSLLDQDLQGVAVYLVDDGSSDGTARVARALAAQTAGAIPLQVVEGRPAPDGWLGKVHALQQGYEAAIKAAERAGTEPPEWLLLTDADIHHRQGSLASLLMRATGEDGRKQFDLVSVMARLRADGFWERVLIPPFVFFFQLLYPFRKVVDPGSTVAAAAGGCVLLRRRSLEAAGGFQSVRNAVIDDVSLAEAVKAAGGRTWLGFDPGIRSLRAYPRLGDLWQMVSRTAFTQLRYSGILLLLTLMALTIFVVLPPWVLGGVVYQAASGGDVDGSGARALLAATGAWLVMALAALPAFRYHRVPVTYALALPLSGLLFGLMTAGSAWNHWRGRGATWRGRRLPPA